MFTTKLYFKDYCQNCRMVNPCAENIPTHLPDGTVANVIHIHCKHEEYCENLNEFFGGTEKVGS